MFKKLLKLIGFNTIKHENKVTFRWLNIELGDKFE